MAAKLMSFLRDKRGAIAITSAFAMTGLIGFVALGVDLGSIYLDRRKAQGTADLAALAAAANLANAASAASVTIAGNDVRKTAHRLEYGIYTADPAVAPSQRFAPSATSSANAVRISLDTATPLFFARVITGRETMTITTTATATLSSFASFSVGSRLASVNGGLINKMLGGLLGTTLSLSAMDYEALIALKLDAFDVVKALGTRLDLTAGTYESVLSANAKVGDIAGAMLDTAKAQYGSLNRAVIALDHVAQATQGLMTKVKVMSVVDLGPYSAMAFGAKPKVSAALPAYNMLSAVAELANDEHQVAVALDVNLPGIASATLKLAIGERPQGSSWATFGATGATVHTAQTRLLLIVNLIGAPPYAAVSVPIYLEIAQATAKLTGLTCGFPDISTSKATMDVTPGLIDAWIGDVSAAEFTNFTRAPNPGPAKLVDLAALKVTGRAHVNISNMSPTPVTFSYSEILNQTKKTVGTTDFTATLLSRLVGDLQLGVNVLGLGLGLGGPVISSGIKTLLANAASSIDQLLTSVLQTAGVGLGQADVWITGIRCDGAVLVI